MRVFNNSLNIQNNKLYNILLVNDNNTFINKFNKILSKKYNVFTANNGYEAINKLKKIHRPDLIITNIEMPIMDGHIFLEELSKYDNYYTIPFIFIIPSSSENIAIKSSNECVIDYISIPFNNIELETKIESLIHKEYDK